jgi:tetratricopeptide (TPR) repeat protein
MKTPSRCLGLKVAIFTVVTATAVSETAPVVGASYGQEQPAPPIAPAKPREVTLEQRGDICMARKNYEDAVDYYYRALRQTSFKNPELWNKMGIAFQQDSRLHDAHKAYVKATHLDENFAEAWNNIGTIYSLEKKYRRSLPYYERAVKLKNEVAAFHINLGSTYYHLKRYPKAVEEYRTALRIDPKAVSSESAVGTVVHAGGTDMEYYYYMAKALASVGNAEVAVRYLRRALEEGFHDRQRIDDDPDFKKISKDPAFVELMRNPPVAIKD